MPLDGFRHTHDRIKGTKGSFEKVRETIKSLTTLKKKFKNLKVHILTVANKLNLSEIVELSEFMKEKLPVGENIEQLKQNFKLHPTHNIQMNWNIA